MEENIIIYAVMPSYIYKTKKLTSEEKLIAERITYLCKKEGYCWITNKTLGEMYGIREDTVSKHIRKLKNFGFIKCTYSKNNQYKSNRTICLTNHIWDKYTSDTSINKQEDIGYIKGYNKNYKNKNNIKVPCWLDKEIKEKPATEEQQRELKKLLNKYRH